MTRMKIFATLLVVLSLFSCNTATAEKWKKDDAISVRAICRYEQDTLQIARADTHSEAAVLNIMNSMISVGRCIVFPVRINFKVERVIIRYKDFRKRRSVVLKVYMVTKKKFTGYLIAQEIEDTKA
jgi:hypothetical protein